MEPFQIAAPHARRDHDEHLYLDFDCQATLLGAKPLGLTREEYDLLVLLLKNAGELLTRETLKLRESGYSARSTRAHWMSISAFARRPASSATHISKRPLA